MKFEIGKKVKLVSHPVIQLAQQTPTFLLDRKVYAAGNGEINGFSFEKRGFFSTIKKPVFEVASFLDLDDLFLERAHLEIDAAEREYARRAQDALDVFKRIKGEFDVPQFIYRRVFPYLGNGTRSRRLAELLGVPYLEKEAEKIGKKIEVSKELAREGMAEIKLLMKKIESEEGEVRGKRENKLDDLLGFAVEEHDYFLSRAFDHERLAMVDGEIYQLVEGDKRQKMYFNLNGKSFALTKTDLRLEDWEKKYSIPLSKEVRLEALEKYFSEEMLMEALKDKESETLEIADKDFYEQGEF